MISLEEIQSSLRSGAIDMSDLVDGYLAKIQTSKHLNIYLEVYEEEIRQQAIKLSKKIQHQSDELGKLFGLVVSIKDVLCYKDHNVSAASKMLEGFKSQYTATAVQRLLDEDALIIGRTNCDEFAMGSSNENSAYGTTKNGQDEDRVPGGSSGGAAVSVQMETCQIALGSDTGGSVRQPAAFCGVIGMKPSYGRISRYGLIAYASSFDQIGLLGKHVGDIAKTLEVISGEDHFDATSSSIPVENYSNFKDLKKARYAYFSEVVDHPKLNPLIRKETINLLDGIRQEGNQVDSVDFELLSYLVPTYYVLTTAEASSNLSRYDGVRYGHRSTEISSFGDFYHKTRTEAFGEEVKRRIMLGTFVLSSGYYDAYYAKAQKVRRMILNAVNQIFENYDFIVIPTSTDIPWKIGSYDNDPVSIYLSDVFTVLANLTGLPAISVPLGKDVNGNSFGIQLMGSKFNEADLLSAAISFREYRNS